MKEEAEEIEVEVIEQSNAATPKTIVVIQQRKSMILGLILTFFFGSLGMLYSTISGGLIMFVLSIIVGVFTLGFGLIFIWPIQLIWTIIAISNHNSKQERRVRRL